MKIDNTPLLYRKYKDKEISLFSLTGIIVGYFIVESKFTMLIVETNTIFRQESIVDWVKKNNFTLRDYHGDEKKSFLLVSQIDFDRKDAQLI